MRYEKSLIGDWECAENCECLGDKWKEEQNNLCVALGDCGSIVNYIGKEGFHDITDLITISESDKNDDGEN